MSYQTHKLKKKSTRMKGDLIKGGLSDKIPPSEFKHLKDQIKMGIKVEAEHTTSKMKAAEIARDHLTEDPLYYTHLKEMEDKNKASKSKMAPRPNHVPFNRELRDKFDFIFTKVYKGKNVDTIWITGHVGWKEEETDVKAVREMAGKYFGEYHIKTYFKPSEGYPRWPAIVIKLHTEEGLSKKKSSKSRRK